MHEWGDKDFDWEGLDKAGYMLFKFCKRWGRLGLHVKEKYGTLRAYVGWHHQLHDLIWPGYMYYRYPWKWLMTLDICYITPTLNRTISPAIRWWQGKVYNWGYQKILKEFPHLREEILVDADYPELIKGSKDVIEKHWVTLGDGDEDK